VGQASWLALPPGTGRSRLAQDGANPPSPELQKRRFSRSTLSGWRAARRRRPTPPVIPCAGRKQSPWGGRVSAGADSAAPSRMRPSGHTRSPAARPEGSPCLPDKVGASPAVAAVSDRRRYNPVTRRLAAPHPATAMAPGIELTHPWGDYQLSRVDPSARQRPQHPVDLRIGSTTIRSHECP
jgi:hypothetical protein